MFKQVAAFTVILFALASFQISAESPALNVAVVYNRNTPVNSEATHFIAQQARAQKKGYTFKFFRDPREAEPGKFDAIIVLNTGMKSGIDPVIASFLSAVPEGANVVCVNLEKGSGDYSVTKSSFKSPLRDIDVVTAASKWEGRGLGTTFGGKPAGAYGMHLSWIEQVFGFLDAARKGS